MNSYHWALLIGPKGESDASRGYRMHAKDTSFKPGGSEWVFEEIESSMQATRQILARVVIAKVADRERLFQILRSVPVIQANPAWNCVIWVKEALAAVQADGKAIGTAKLDWQTVRDAAMEYVEKKKEAHRFDGKVQYDTMAGDVRPFGPERAYRVTTAAQDRAQLEFHHVSPKYFCRILSIRRSSGRGSMKSSMYPFQNSFLKLTCIAVVYSQ